MPDGRERLDVVSAFDEAAARVRAGADPHAEAGDLVDAMTVDERLGCLDGDLPYWPGVIDMMGGGYWAHPWPAARVERLGVPGIAFADGPRGCVIGPSTVFPVSMARGASFDPELEREIGAAIGAELRVNGATFTGAVCMNLLRHPAWGRAQETYGEDPHHVGVMAEALTLGLQRHVMACMKHFALNSMENARFSVDVTADERALHEVYLPHFRRVAAAGVAATMTAYNSVNGRWCGENAELITDVLRDEWGWDGMVITDFVAGLRDPVASVLAGCDIEMPFRQQRALALPDALAGGRLDEADVSARAAQVVATLLRFAVPPAPAPPVGIVAGPAHRALARRAAVAATVLVHNTGLLPVDRATLGRVAVLGRLAGRPNTGDGGSSHVRQPDVTTPLAGLRAALDGVEVVHSVDDATIADGADLAVVVVGYTAADEGEFIGDAQRGGPPPEVMPPTDHPEVGMGADMAGLLGGDVDAAPDAPAEDEVFGRGGGDRRSLALPEGDVALIAEVAARHDRVVVVLQCGSAVLVPWLEDVQAVLVTWYAGMEGGHALADVVLGRAEPGGRLPFAVPHEAADLVDFDPDADAATYELLHGQWHLDDRGVAPHLPFGHGLGYTTIELTSAGRQVPLSQTSPGPTVEVELVETGGRGGKAVVFAFASVPGSRHRRPPRRLVGFDAVVLDPGETRTVGIGVDLDLLDVRVGGGWETEDLPVVIEVGLDAAHLIHVNNDQAGEPGGPLR